jgi:DNA-binding NtrC family response regulator
MATMLIIDDEQPIRQILDALFSPAHECHTADRAEQALEFLEFQAYDLVITDISMPGLGGVEILRAIKERHPATPVIVVTARADQFRDTVMEMGAFAFFAKPFNLSAMENAVARAIACHHKLVGSEVPSAA